MTIKVKPLVWAHVPQSRELGTEPYDHAEGFGGSYVVEHRAAGHFDMWKPNLSNGDRFSDLEAAKAAAQADYEARILSAIEAGDPATIRAEALRDKIAAKAREYADHYPQSSDGRNTFLMFAEWVEALALIDKEQDK